MSARKLGRPALDMTGRVFTRWRVLRRAGSDRSRQALWLCVCACGRRRKVRGYHLRTGSSTGCKACAASERARHLKEMT